ncbi:hypothetical protein TRAPUB_13390 [Trametes pubescens]|uniref:Uncharacterized protein n=1 Tax=Trametes pubescens TaxID=154538 RepID=A0A1M2VR75_TRAPU|nr:hypothetical protein TRAPUB_13390 [Trametes pubescens]
MVSSPTSDDEESARWMALHDFSESFSARVHPLQEVEYEAAANHVLELIENMTCMDDMDEPFETVYDLCYLHADSTVAANLLAKYSIRSREIGCQCATARVKEAEEEIASMKSRREEILQAEHDARISTEEGKNQRVAINRIIDNRMRDLDVLRVLLGKAAGELKYARGKGRYLGHTYPQPKSSSAQPATRAASVISIHEDPNNELPCTESVEEAHNIDSPVQSPPRKRRNRGTPTTSNDAVPQPEKDDETQFAVIWPGACDRCDRLNIECAPADTKVPRCSNCNPQVQQCLFNGMNVNGEVKVGRKVLGLYNGKGISFPTHFTKSERKDAEGLVRKILANWRAPLSVYQPALTAKLKNYDPAQPAITVFLHPATEVVPASLSTTAARDVVHGKRSAFEADEDPPTLPISDVPSQRPLAGSTRVASKIRMELRAASEAPAPPSSSQTAADMSGITTRSASPLPQGSSAPAPSTAASSVAGSSSFTVPARDRLVAALRLRYNQMLAEYTMINLQLTMLREEEQKLTGLPFGEYVSDSSSTGMHIEQPYPVWDGGKNRD